MTTQSAKSKSSTKNNKVRAKNKTEAKVTRKAQNAHSKAKNSPHVVENMILRLFADDPSLSEKKREERKEARDAVIGLLNHAALSQRYYKIAGLCPPNSILDDIVKRFDEGADPSLELPLFTMMLMFSSVLLKKGVVYNLRNNKIPPTIWIVLLSTSGDSKSFVLRCIENLFKKCGQKDLAWKTKAKSSLVWLQEFAGVEKNGEVIKECNNRRVLIVDEATDWFKKIKDEKGPMCDIYPNLLLAYSHDEIGSDSKSSGSIVVSDPAISMLCTATPGRYIEQTSEADMEGGLFFRQIHVVTDDNDKTDYVSDYNILEGLEEKLEKLIGSIKHTEYFASDEAYEYGRMIFNKLAKNVNKPEGFPKGYVKRICWYMHKFALLYHFFDGNGHNQIIGKRAYEQTERLIDIFNTNAAKIIKEKLGSEAQEKLARVERLIERRKEQGKKTTPRDIVINTKLTTQEAKAYLEIALGVEVSKDANKKVKIPPASLSDDEYDEIMKDVPKRKVPGGKLW